MLFWILAALMTGAAVMAVLVPLARRTAAAEDVASHDRAVYRDQLAELERERAEGLIGAAEAEAARAEIARRLLAAAGPTQRTTGGSPTRRRAAALAGLVGIPAVAFALYLGQGAPGLPGQPLQARLQAPGTERVDLLVARVEDHLGKNPEDGQGWEVLAPVYMRLGRPGDAAKAYRNAIRILGSSAEREAGLGEAIAMLEGGIVTKEAREAFERARAADPAAPKPRFFLALAREQAGDTRQAAADWRALLADSPPEAPWRPAVEAAVARLEGAAPAAAPGPSQEDVAAAAEMSTGDRGAMVEAMVGRLAERLKQQPQDVEGWLRLMRAYTVLGRGGEASAAAQTAMASVPDGGGRERIAALAAELGIGLQESGRP